MICVILCLCLFSVVVSAAVAVTSSVVVVDDDDDSIACFSFFPSPESLMS